MDAGINIRPFQPFSSIEITADTTTNGIAATFTSAQDLAAPHVMISNTGSVKAYMSIGGNAVAATSTPSLNSVPIPAGVVMMFYKNPGVATLRFIAASTSTIIEVTCGLGS